MPEARKLRVVIASVLKPVDDTRGYGKIGTTLASSGIYDVHIIGSGIAHNSQVPHIHFHPLGRIDRISWTRWTTPFKVFTKIRELQPHVLVIATHELIWTAVAVRILGTRIVYDVQENYLRNIRYTDAFPWPLNWLVALWVRTKEVVCAPFFSLFILAEKVYYHQLTFARNKSVVIENKANVPPNFQRQPASGLELLFSGTLAESTGVFEAVRLSTALHDADNSIRLHIIGYCADKSALSRLKGAVSGKSFITLTGADEVQPHASIMRAISKASFGIVCYPSSPHTTGAFPTKVYEYLACRLPALVTPPWAPLFAPHNAGVTFDRSTSAAEVLEQMKTATFYSTPPTDVYWDAEGRKLLEAMGKMVTQA